jgi:HlyD family secretion protein
MLKKIVIAVIVVGLLVAGGWWYLNYRSTQTAKAAQASVTTAPLEKGDLVETVSATGKVRAGQTTDLGWQTSGTVESVNVKLGDKVTAGQVLARLKQTSLPQSAINAQADLITAKQNLDDLTTQAKTSKTDALQQITQLESDLRDAQFNLDNFTIPTDQAKLSTTDALTQMKQRLDEARKAFDPYKYFPASDETRKSRLEDLNLAQSNYNTAVKRLEYESKVEVAQANLDKAWADFNKYANGPSQDDVQVAQAKVAAAEAALSQAWIEAPFDGTITQVNVQPGDRASSASGAAAAFRLDNLDHLYVDLDVSEIDIDKVKIGQDAIITLDAVPQTTYHGKVSNIANVSTTTSGAVNFTVTVQFTDADQAVRPGMTSEVKINVGKQTAVLLIPLQAIEMKNGKQIVYVQEQPGQTPKAMPVKLGMSSDEYSALIEGNLKEGDQIVLNPATMSGQSQTNNAMFRFGPGGGGPPPGEGRNNQGGGNNQGGNNQNGGNQSGGGQP